MISECEKFNVLDVIQQSTSVHFLSQVKTENNILRDGTLIDLCGATLLWRSAAGLLFSPVSTTFHENTPLCSA
jgi:hypothetical protein